MKISEWQSFLKTESQRVIDDYDIAEFWVYPDFPEDVFETEWLGFSGASGKAISSAEMRLDKILPPSYRNFLMCSNGWRGYAGLLTLLSIDTIDWFRKKNQEWINAYEADISNPAPESPESEYVSWPNLMKYLPMTLQVSEPRDGDVILLNSGVISDGEWEAWLFGKTSCGAKRYRSFSDLFRALVSQATQTT